MKRDARRVWRKGRCLTQWTNRGYNAKDHHGVRALNHGMMDGLRALVVDALKQRALILHLHVHRLELGWVEDRCPAPGDFTPVPDFEQGATSNTIFLNAEHLWHCPHAPGRNLKAARRQSGRFLNRER